MVNIAKNTPVDDVDGEAAAYDGDGGDLVYDDKEPVLGDCFSSFHTTCIVGDHKCHVIVDNGSCNNAVSQDAIKKLKLPCEKHPMPYKLSWFKKGNE